MLAVALSGRSICAHVVQSQWWRCQLTAGFPRWAAPGPRLLGLLLRAAAHGQVEGLLPAVLSVHHHRGDRGGIPNLLRLGGPPADARFLRARARDCVRAVSLRRRRRARAAAAGGSTGQAVQPGQRTRPSRAPHAAHGSDAVRQRFSHTSAHRPPGTDLSSPSIFKYEWRL
jgi:hypothetical protein